MTEQEPTKEEIDRYWDELIDEWEVSGQNMSEWVRNRDDITYEQFYWHKRRLRPQEGVVGEFLNEETTWSTIKMEIPTSTIDVYVKEYRVVVKSGFDQELLHEVMEVLKR